MSLAVPRDPRSLRAARHIRGRSASDSATSTSDAGRGEHALGTWGEEHSAAALSSCRGEDAAAPKERLLRIARGNFRFAASAGA